MLYLKNDKKRKKKTTLFHFAKELLKYSLIFDEGY